MDLAFITDHWPQLIRYIPESEVELYLDKISDGVRIDGYCNNEAAPLDHWVGRVVVLGMFPPFATDPEVPPGYFACGVHIRGNSSEYLFAMWERDGRRFWFYTRYFSVGNPTGHSTSQAAEELDTALRRWEGGTASVMYHGEWGWFRPDANKWEYELT
jgi:hypothetical protein